MADKLMDVKIMAPDRVFYEGQVSFIEFNTTEGILGIYPKHIPMTVVISPGVLKIVEENGETKEAALLSGFAEVLGDSITMLAESVEWPDEIDIKRAEEAKIRAERRLKDDSQDLNRAELALKRSVVRMQLGAKWK
ncbi:MAG: ATP synthase F1 subunit epsilon [Lachnospiraceae bacterium]|nr:ATP synthase F1 subunit epsilon [Lachnospiraceae bacterium]MBR3834124.1 ATP synthase F1 subunit epsilon [Lachnospiraceae bacterium]